MVEGSELPTILQKWISGHAVVVIGTLRARQQIITRLASVAVIFATLVHPSVLAPAALQPPHLGEAASTCYSTIARSC